MVKILDCTTRDGGFCKNWDFDDQFVFNLINKLNQAGVEYYEIGYRNYFERDGKGKFFYCTPEILHKFYLKKGNLKLGIMVDVKRCNLDDFSNSDNDYLDFIRVACHPDKIKSALDIIQTLYNRGYKVFLQLMDISNIDESGYIELCNFDKKNILTSLYLADTYGNLTEEEVEIYLRKFRSLGYKKISFHAHNKSGLALNNTLKAIKLKVYSIDTTLNGLGKSGGNLDLEELLKYTIS